MISTPDDVVTPGSSESMMTKLKPIVSSVCTWLAVGTSPIINSMRITVIVRNVRFLNIGSSSKYVFRNNEIELHCLYGSPNLGIAEFGIYKTTRSKWRDLTA